MKIIKFLVKKIKFLEKNQIFGKKIKFLVENQILGKKNQIFEKNDKKKLLK